MSRASGAPPIEGKWDIVSVVTADRHVIVDTDSRSRVVLPGHPDERFVMREREDGSILLEPAYVASQAQHDYDVDPGLRELLRRATESKTVGRSYRRRPQP